MGGPVNENLVNAQVCQLVGVNVVAALSFILALALRDLIESIMSQWIPSEEREKYKIRYNFIYAILIFVILVLVAVLVS